MKNLLCIIAIVMTLVLAAVPARAATKVFLLAGQSNMVGLGKVSELTAPYNQSQPGVNFWNSVTNQWVALQGGLPVDEGSTDHSLYFGPEVSFGYAMHNAFPADSIYLIKYAASGSGLADNTAVPAGTWKPSQTTSNPVRLYSSFKSVVTTAMATITSEPPTIAGMLWMQGESDSFFHPDAVAYRNNLAELVSAVRNDFNSPNMKWVSGEIMGGFGTAQDTALVNNGLLTVGDLVGNATAFYTDDLRKWPEGYHYNAQGQIDLGIRFANAFHAPEPTTSIVLITGILSLLVYVWRKRR